MPALADHDIARLRASNPGPLTLSGTNTWVVGRDPAYVIDPGPRLDEHLAAVEVEVAARGGLGGIALTHDHHDHSEAVGELLERCGQVRVGGAAAGDLTLDDGDRFGPLLVLRTPGHSPDHLAFAAGRACFTGDAVLGEGSVLISPGRGSLAGYLDALRRLRGLEFEVLCPGHGPPVTDAAGRLTGCLEHRLEREQALVAALELGLRSIDELLDGAWADVPDVLRPAATLTLAAHLDKLDEEGALPSGVQRPSWPGRPDG